MNEEYDVIVLGTGLTVSAEFPRRQPRTGEDVQARRGGGEAGVRPARPFLWDAWTLTCTRAFLWVQSLVLCCLILEGSRGKALGWVRKARSTALGFATVPGQVGRL